MLKYFLTAFEERLSAITTPHKLPYFNAMYSLGILLTPAERRRPWILYCTPGLLAAQVARVASVTLILALILLWVLHELLNSGRSFLAKLVAVAFLSRVVLTPLEVIVVRLSVQRNHGLPEHTPLISQDVNDGEGVTGAGEDVIWYVHCDFSFSFIPLDGYSLRTGREPYGGLIDCAKKIIDEEGWSALYRAWWLSTF